jgi:hypothetical protein
MHGMVSVCRLAGLGLGLLLIPLLPNICVVEVNDFSVKHLQVLYAFGAAFGLPVWFFVRSVVPRSETVCEQNLHSHHIGGGPD